MAQNQAIQEELIHKKTFHVGNKGEIQDYQKLRHSKTQKENLRKKRFLGPVRRVLEKSVFGGK